MPGSDSWYFFIYEKTVHVPDFIFKLRVRDIFTGSIFARQFALAKIKHSQIKDDNNIDANKLFFERMQILTWKVAWTSLSNVHIDD